MVDLPPQVDLVLVGVFVHVCPLGARRVEVARERDSVRALLAELRLARSYAAAVPKETFEEKMLALAEKYGVEVTFSQGPPKATGAITLLPGVRPPAPSS